ncbi:50S ribosomal subunit protein L11 [Candidatus Hodgkinia cicadicola]|nr:50S ribosomal subunit protein L11 [Candidatus Hodgkinia cicadicola]
MLEGRVGFIKLCCAPPVSSVLGWTRLNVFEFCKRFNELCATNYKRLVVRFVFIAAGVTIWLLYAPTLTRLVRQMLLLGCCVSEPGGLQLGVLTRADVALLAARKGSKGESAGIRCVAGSLRSLAVSAER